MNKKYILYFIVFLLTLSIGCVNKKGIQKDKNMNNGKDVSFSIVEDGVMSGYREKGNIIIKDEKELKKIWDKIHSIMIPSPSVPKIDFNKYTVIGVFMGEKPTGGYGIEVKNIKEDANKITVWVKEIFPDSKCIVTMVLTSPYQLIKIHKTDKKIEFIKEEIIKKCD